MLDADISPKPVIAKLKMEQINPKPGFAFRSELAAIINKIPNRVMMPLPIANAYQAKALGFRPTATRMLLIAFTG